MDTDCSEEAKQRDSGSVQKTMASITAATSSAPIRQQHLDHHAAHSRKNLCVTAERSIVKSSSLKRNHK